MTHEACNHTPISEHNLATRGHKFYCSKCGLETVVKPTARQAETEWVRITRKPSGHLFTVGAFDERAAKSEATRKGYDKVTWLDNDGRQRHFVKTSKWREVEQKSIIDLIHA